METQGMIRTKVEAMAQDLIQFLQEQGMWDTDVGLIYNGVSVSHRGLKPSDEELRGVMRIWYEGALNHAINYGTGNSIYQGMENIMEKYGYYPEFYSHCDLNVYPI